MFPFSSRLPHRGIKFGIISAIIIIIGIGAYYLAAPLFISTEIDEPLPEGAEVSGPTPPTIQFQEFMTMTELITALRTVVENGEGVLDKETTSHDDLFDAFRLSLMFWG